MEIDTDTRIARVRETMHQRLAERWRIDSLAALAGLSPSRFAHLFRGLVGLSPLRYLQRLRLDRARQLLESTSDPIAEVMRSVGYADASHFSKDFRRHFGAGPREYRRDHRVDQGCRAPATHPGAGAGLPDPAEVSWKAPSD